MRGEKKPHCQYTTRSLGLKQKKVDGLKILFKLFLYFKILIKNGNVPHSAPAQITIKGALRVSDYSVTVVRLLDLKFVRY